MNFDDEVDMGHSWEVGLGKVMLLAGQAGENRR